MEAIGRRDSFLNIIPLSFFLLIVLISASCSAAVTNVLLTGQTLSRQAGLSYAGSKVSFIMQNDCNLVIYDSRGNAIWHSNTAGFGRQNCILSFTTNGRLVVRNPSGLQLWITSNANSKVGKYVAVLRPDGKVSIFGPEVWSISGVKESDSIGRNNSNEIVQPIESLKNSRIVYNSLFSGQVLYRNGKLSENGYSFIMKEDCELVLQRSNGKVSWRTWTKGNGKYCFARLNHKGELAIKGDAYESVWSNWASEKAPVGEYLSCNKMATPLSMGQSFGVPPSMIRAALSEFLQPRNRPLMYVPQVLNGGYNKHDQIYLIYAWQIYACSTSEVN